MDCRTASEHLVPWLEAELAPAVTEVVGEHVAHCPDCASLAERLRAQGERLAAIGPAVDPRLSGDAFWASMDDSLSDAWEQLGEGGSPRPPARPPGRVGSRRAPGESCG